MSAIESRWFPFQHLAIALFTEFVLISYSFYGEFTSWSEFYQVRLCLDDLASLPLETPLIAMVSVRRFFSFRFFFRKKKENKRKTIVILLEFRFLLPPFHSIFFCSAPISPRVSPLETPLDTSFDCLVLFFSVRFFFFLRGKRHRWNKKHIQNENDIQVCYLVLLGFSSNVIHYFCLPIFLDFKVIFSQSMIDF